MFIKLLFQSSSSFRVKRCEEVLNDPIFKSTTNMKLLSDFTRLTEKLIELTEKPIANVSFDNFLSINNFLNVHKIVKLVWTSVWVLYRVFEKEYQLLIVSVERNLSDCMEGILKVMVFVSGISSSELWEVLWEDIHQAGWAHCKVMLNTSGSHFRCSFKKCILQTSSWLSIPETMVHNVLHNWHKLHGYKLQLLYNIQSCVKPKHFQFMMFIFEQIDANAKYNNIPFSDEATFHTSDDVNHKHCRSVGTKNQYAIIEHVWGSPIVYVWCSIMSDPMFGPFFFSSYFQSTWICWTTLCFHRQQKSLALFLNRMMLHILVTLRAELS